MATVSSVCSEALSLEPMGLVGHQEFVDLGLVDELRKLSKYNLVTSHSQADSGDFRWVVLGVEWVES